MYEVLNPVLFHALKQKLGEVRVSRVGEPRDVRVEILRRGLAEVPRRRGEKYHVRCPFCRDKGQHLAVSYMFASLNEFGTRRTDLAWCDNASCLAEGRRREELFLLLFPDGVEKFRISRSKDETFDLPSRTTPLSELPEQHKAVSYLAELGLNTSRLASTYGLGYCDAPAQNPASQRIVIPVYQCGELCGWQGLCIDTKPKPDGSKYLSAPGMKSDVLVYNLDRARKYQTGVIVSEPLEVWKFGPMALCPCTADSWSNLQIQSVLVAFREGNVVGVRLHRSRPKGWNALFDKLLSARIPVSFVNLPRSALRYDRESLRAAVRDAAEQAEFEVHYNKRASRAYG